MEPRVYRSAVDGRYYGLTSSRLYEAQLITPEDIAAIEAVTVLDEILGLARPLYRLRGMCRPIRMDKLTARVDIATVLTGQEKVPPLVEAEISAEAYTSVDFDLWKNVAHVAISDEAAKRAGHDIMQLHTEDAARDLARMENKQIKEIAEANITEKVSTVVYADWGAMTTAPNSDTNPMEAILSSMDYIIGKGFTPDFIAMHPTLMHKFILNTWIRELIKGKIMTFAPNGASFQIPGYPKMSVIVDPALTETPTGSVGPIVGSSRAPGLILGQGPVEAAKYRDEPIGYTGYIIRQWLEPMVVLDDALDLICT